MVLFPGRGKGEAAWLVDSPRGARLRLAQYRCFIDPACRLGIARDMVVRKISGQARWLDAHGKPALLDRFIDSAGQAADIPALMGVEGAAAARYFHHWGVLWDAAWGFNGRNRRPPRDPINALLSLSYTLAGSYVGRLPAMRGMDGGLGFLHGPERDRPALRLDLLEPLRPWVDQWVWQQLQDGLIEPGDFHYSKAVGCRLNEQGRKAYFGAWFRDEDAWLRTEARFALAGVLTHLRPLI